MAGPSTDLHVHVLVDSRTYPSLPPPRQHIHDRKHSLKKALNLFRGPGLSRAHRSCGSCGGHKEDILCNMLEAGRRRNCQQQEAEWRPSDVRAARQLDIALALLARTSKRRRGKATEDQIYSSWSIAPGASLSFMHAHPSVSPRCLTRVTSAQTMCSRWRHRVRCFFFFSFVGDGVVAPVKLPADHCTCKVGLGF